MNTTVPELIRRVHETYLPQRHNAWTGGVQGQSATLFEHSELPGAFQSREWLLQALWNEQALTAPLTLANGDPLVVLSPGTWNVEAGPDFHQAALLIRDTPVTGDVEIHCRELDWYRHGHHLDPAYDRVVVHAAWICEPQRDSGMPPCLDLSAAVRAPLDRLLPGIETHGYPYARRVPTGACAVRWALLDDAQVREHLNVAGLARLGDKADALRQTIAAVGPGQALYQAVFEALGYKANSRALRHLAATTPLDRLRQCPDHTAREALVFGMAGLLPDPTTTPIPRARRDRVEELWHAWWEQGAPTLQLDWRRGGSRPLNSPERRLAAGVRWLELTGADPETWFCETLVRKDEPGGALLRGLKRSLDFESDWDLWVDFRHGLARPARLLGRNRILDLAANVFLPFWMALARLRNRPDWEEKATTALLELPRLQGNRALKEVTHRFFMPPSRARDVIRGAVQQQGLLALYRDFCLQLSNACSNCPLAGATGSPRNTG
jgi:hypothetical protein